MEIEKVHKNRGKERNKKPLKNIIYRIDLMKELKAGGTGDPKYDQYKFKDEGYMVLYWHYDEKNPIRKQHGFITPTKFKEMIGEKQWSKFCGEGKREFVIQRRINGKNIKK